MEHFVCGPGDIGAIKTAGAAAALDHLALGLKIERFGV